MFDLWVSIISPNSSQRVPARKMADDPASAETAGAAPAPEETTVAVDPSSSEGAAADDPKAAEPPAEPKKEKNPIKDGKGE